MQILLHFIWHLEHPWILVSARVCGAKELVPSTVIQIVPSPCSLGADLSISFRELKIVIGVERVSCHWERAENKIELSTSWSDLFPKAVWLPEWGHLRPPQHPSDYIRVYCLSLFSCSVVPSSLQPHGLYSMPGFLSFTISQLFKLMSIESTMPSNISQWCHLILCCPLLLLSCPQSFPASGSFPTSQLFASGGQSIVASASASVLPMSIQGWFL